MFRFCILLDSESIIIFILESLSQVILCIVLMFRFCILLDSESIIIFILESLSQVILCIVLVIELFYFMDLRGCHKLGNQF